MGIDAYLDTAIEYVIDGEETDEDEDFYDEEE
jgi:hypothetical protein